MLVVGSSALSAAHEVEAGIVAGSRRSTSASSGLSCCAAAIASAVDAGAGRVEAAVGERPHQPGPERHVVVDDQQRTRFGHRGIRAPARPGAGRGSRWCRRRWQCDRAPPLRSAKTRARNRPSPRPRPVPLVVKNGSPARASTSGDMPGPRSRTSMRTPVPSRGLARGDLDGGPGGTGVEGVASRARAPPGETPPARCGSPAARAPASTHDPGAAPLGQLAGRLGDRRGRRRRPRVAARCCRRRGRSSDRGSPDSDPPRCGSAARRRPGRPRPAFAAVRSSSRAARAMVASGVESSCAAPAASVVSDTSRSSEPLARMASSSRSRVRARATPARRNRRPAPR